MIKKILFYGHNIYQMVSWVEAVKAYAKETGKWSVPKKGTPEYDAVKALQDKMNSAPIKAPESEVKKRGRPKKPEVAPVEVKEEVAPVVVKEKKEKPIKEKKVKAMEVPVAPIASVTPIAKEKKKAVKVEPEVPIVKEKPLKKAVKVAEPSGKEPTMETVSEKKPKAVRAEKKTKAVGIRIENQQVVLSFD